MTNQGNSRIIVNTYDEYGIPGTANGGRFQYTGQAWVPDLGMFYYKARMYSPTLGRSMQTDPIGYGDGLNWYNYAHSDPVNGRDPSGLAVGVVPPPPPPPGDGPDIVVIGGRSSFDPMDGGLGTLGMFAKWNDIGYLLNVTTAGSNELTSTKSHSPQSGQKKVDCNSDARQLAKLANNVSVAAGGSGLVFAGLGAEPVAAGLELTAGIAEVVAAGAGAYVAYSEGDWGPLKSTVVGKVAGSLGGFGASVLGTRSASKFGLAVTKTPSATQTKAAGYASGFAGDLLNQVCP